MALFLRNQGNLFQNVQVSGVQMKLPRDCDSGELIRALRRIGYSIDRQTGSHITMTSRIGVEHHVTIPNHRPVRVGTLQAILKDIAGRREITVQDLLEKLEI